MEGQITLFEWSPEDCPEGHHPDDFDLSKYMNPPEWGEEEGGKDERSNGKS
jgi:hypothetical protein